MSTNILENLTENTELLEAKDVKKKCRHCALWTKWCSTVGQRSRKCIAPTENQYSSKIKLWGHPEEYLEIKYVKAIKTDGLAQMVWEWIEQLMVTGNGKRYLTTCFRPLANNDFGQIRALCHHMTECKSQHAKQSNSNTSCFFDSTLPPS